MPRIIDFGLAKAVTPIEPDEALATRAGGFVGTFGYTSPEQADPRIQDIDTRTDVYSLGVILYELLAGVPPFDIAQLKKLPLDEVLRQLRERDAPPPSAQSRIEKNSAEMRGTEPKRLVSQLKGDLDWITMKALEKDRNRRYGTATELAADITRHLQNQMVVARPALAGYRLQKYLLRHRVAASVATGLIVLLAGFSAVEAVQLRRITRERDRANRITDFMTGMFKVSDPGQARGNNITAREILDRASKDINTGLIQDPELQSQMMMVMGQVYENLGLYDQAGSLYGQSAAIRERQLGLGHSDTLKSKAALAWALYRRGHYRESEDLLRQTLAIRIRRFGVNNADTMTVMDSLGAVLNEENHAADAESLERQVLAFRRRVLGDHNPDTLVAMNHLSLALQSQGRWPEAESIDRQQIALWRQIEGTDSPRGLLAADNLAIILYREGRMAEAESLDRETLATKRHILGPDHPETVRSMNTLTAVLTDEGKLNEARTLAEQVLAIRTRVLGPDHPLTLSAMSNFAEILTRLGNYAEAEKLLVQAKTTLIKKLGPDSAQTAITTYNMACLALRRGRRDEALQLLNDAVNHGLASWVVTDMVKDPDLEPLHGDPRFNALVAEAQKRTGVQH
jgi:non-specific serine/threonine protein kinase/serine/threonine-protein kinase